MNNPIWRIEKSELSLFGICAFAVALIWLILAGSWTTVLFMNHDAVFFLPRYAHYLQGSTWQDYLYRSDFLGGAMFSEVYGKPPALDLLSFLKLNAQTSMNLMLMLVQSFFAYFGIRCVLLLARLWGQEAKPHSLTIFGLALVFAFLPVLGARTQYGHIDLIWGLLFFLVLLSATLSLKLKDWNTTYFILTVLALWHIIPTCGHQTKLYSIVFGAPIIFGFIYTSSFKNLGKWFKENNQSVFVLGGALLAGLFVSLPRFVGMLDYAISDEGLRAVAGSDPVVYKYTGTEFLNYLSSIFWNYKLAARTTDVLLISEFYFPMGPFLLMLLLVPKAYRMPVWVGLTTSLGLSIFLSLKVWPINEFLINFVPAIKSFRVPERSILPFCTALAVIGSSLIIAKFNSRANFKSLLAATVVIILLLALPDWPKEILLWLISAAIVYSVYQKKPSEYLSAPALILVFGIGSVFAFQAWRTSFPDKTTDLLRLAKAGEQIKSQIPELKSPLTRVFLDLVDPNFSIATAAATNISVVEAYSMPLRRFAELYSELENFQLEPTMVVFRLGLNNRSAPVLRGLYNICCHIDLNEGSRLQIERLNPTAGPVWTSTDIGLHPNIKSLAAELSRNQNNLSSFLRGKILLNTSDLRVKERLSELTNIDFSQCFQAAPQLTTSREGEHTITRQSTSGICPLTLATNYTRRFHAYELIDGKPGRKLNTLPTYGALQAVLVPGNITNLVVRIEPYIPIWAAVLGWFGWLMLLSAIYFKLILKKLPVKL